MVVYRVVRSNIDKEGAHCCKVSYNLKMLKNFLCLSRINVAPSNYRQKLNSRSFNVS